jgi:putative transcriptional regulator
MPVNEVKDTRQKLGLSQTEFAQIVGVHPITVSKWERGDVGSKPTPYHRALFTQFREAAKDKTVRSTIRDVLITAGVIVVLAILLKHLTTKK